MDINMKSKRHERILALIQEKPIQTQEELADALRKEGYDVTQATVSRDIKELNLLKTPSGDGSYKYSVVPHVPQEQQERLHRLFASTVVSVHSANNIIVLKTMQGSANTVAVVIDGLSNEDILGCVAGDDTVIVVISGNDKVAGVVHLINDLIH